MRRAKLEFLKVLAIKLFKTHPGGPTLWVVALFNMLVHPPYLFGKEVEDKERSNIEGVARAAKLAMLTLKGSFQSKGEA
jgi:hypothetical protein